MYDEAQPAPDTTTAASPPAREGQSNGATQPQDNAKVSGPVAQPDAPKKPRTPPRTPQEKARDDAKEAVKKAQEALEIAEAALVASIRASHIKAGRLVVVARIEAMNPSEREAMMGNLPQADPEQVDATQRYLAALMEEAKIAAEKLAEKTAKEQGEKTD